MKTFLQSFILLTLSGCAGNIYEFCQIYSTSSNDVNFTGNEYVYENQDVIIYYDLWDNNGNPDFTVYNKTNIPIYINLENCCFIVNGYANDYYGSRTFTEMTTTYRTNGYSTTEYYRYPRDTSDKRQTTKNVGYSTSHSETTTKVSENTVDFTEKKVIFIPTNSKKIVRASKL